MKNSHQSTEAGGTQNTLNEDSYAIDFHVSIRFNNERSYILGEMHSFSYKAYKAEDGNISVEGVIKCFTSNVESFSYAYNLLNEGVASNSLEVPSFDLSVIYMEVDENKNLTMPSSRLLIKSIEIISEEYEIAFGDSHTYTNYKFRANGIESLSFDDDVVTAIPLH